MATTGIRRFNILLLYNSETSVYVCMCGTNQSLSQNFSRARLILIRPLLLRLLLLLLLIALPTLLVVVAVVVAVVTVAVVAGTVAAKAVVTVAKVQLLLIVSKLRVTLDLLFSTAVASGNFNHLIF